MPNWCSNVATINHGDKEKIDAIEAELNKDKDDVALFQMLCPCPEEQKDNWYEWNINNWGTKWDASVYDFERIDDYNIRINFDTAWSPPTALYDYLFEQGYDITAYYDECGMAFCGKYEFGSDDYYDYSDMDSSQVQEDIPTDIDEMFSISEQMADREAEDDHDDWQSDEDDEEVHAEIEPEYEYTEWYTSDVHPVREGLYEIKAINNDEYKAWPFAFRCAWLGDKWNLLNGEVTEWRGITEKCYNEITELETV